MPLVFAAVMPHGGSLIPELDDGVNGSALLTEAMFLAARAAADARLDVLIVANPHGLGAADAHSVAVAPSFFGQLDHLHMQVPSDRALAEEVLAAAIEEELPAAGVMISLDGQPFPMDWGLFVPCWFLARNAKVPPVVMVVPSRLHGLESLARFGEVIAGIAESSDLRFGLIASADNAHAHLEDGPYGFHPSAKDFDARVVSLTESGDHAGYLDLEDQLMQEALPDSPWQLAILAGAFRRVPFETVSCTYDCPSYFGMMVATFSRCI